MILGGYLDILCKLDLPIVPAYLFIRNKRANSLNMLRIFFCPFCHRFFKEEDRIFHVNGGPEPIETHEELLRKAMEFLSLQEKPKDGLEVDFQVICRLCFSTDRGGASQCW
jgi:hypothetical protein